MFLGLGASDEGQDVNKDMTDWPAGSTQLGIYQREYGVRSCDTMCVHFRRCVLVITWNTRRLSPCH